MINKREHMLCTLQEVIQEMELMYTLQGIMYEEVMRKLIKKYVEVPNNFPFIIGVEQIKYLYNHMMQTLWDNNLDSIVKWFLIGKDVCLTEAEENSKKAKQMLREFETEYYWDYDTLKPLFPKTIDAELLIYDMYLTRTFKKENKKCAKQNKTL